MINTIHNTKKQKEKKKKSRIAILVFEILVDNKKI